MKHVVTVVAVLGDGSTYRCMIHGQGRTVDVSSAANLFRAPVAVGTVAEYVSEGGKEMLSPLKKRRAVPCTVFVEGVSAVLRGPEGSGIELRLPGATLGLEGSRALEDAEGKTYFILVPPGTGEGHWAEPQSSPATREPNAPVRESPAPATDPVADRRERAWLAGNPARLAPRAAKAPAGGGGVTPEDRFINPYTFVPLPLAASDEEMCRRAAPPGHALLAPDRLLGAIRVRWTVRSPLLIRDGDKGTARESSRVPRRPASTAGQVETPFVPGSSIKGAVRSLHETLTGGCLRVFEGEFIPAYRMPASSLPGWTLAIIESDREGTPERVQLCDQVAWARASELHTVVGGSRGLKTGVRVSVNVAKTYFRKERQRTEVDAGGVTPGNGWVVVVTDAGARRRGHPYSCAVGQIGNRSVRVPQKAYDDYLHAVRDAEDLRQGRVEKVRSTGDAEFAEVTFDHQSIGWRRRVTTSLRTGDVVWVRCSQQSGDVEAIALSRIWRQTGAHSMQDRVPRALLPCRHPDKLCPSCRLFGSVDAGGADKHEKADQRAYRGHVRFGDGVFIAGFSTKSGVKLAPLGAPRPGAGQFYLVNTSAAPARSEHDRPTREWGSTADAAGSPRPLRGRKYYWHGDPEATRDRATGAPARHEAMAKANAEMAATVELVTGGTFEAEIRFEGLTRAEIGGLIAAIDPQRVLRGRAPAGSRGVELIRPRIGGGKPVGLGTVDVEIVELRGETAAGRYAGGEATSLGVDECVASFQGDEEVPAAARATWPVLAAVLDVNRVDPKRIAYPPAFAWTQSGHPDFRAGFAFWKASSGRYLKNAPREMSLLPEPLAADPSLPIERE